MVETKNVLNLGLDALFKAKDTADSGIVNINENKQELIHYIDVNSLSPGKYQPRKYFNQDELNNLANSIKQQGILQPLIIRNIGKESFEIIAGERRWRASKIAGLTVVPAIIRNVTDSAAAAFAIIENVQRQDLNPVEEAESYKKLIDEFTLTHEDVARIVGKSRATVSNTLRLLNLDASVIHLLKTSELEMGHARAILAVPQDKQHDIASTVINKKLTVRAAEKLIRNFNFACEKVEIDPLSKDCEQWSKILSRKLSTKVSVKLNQSGSGKVTIQVSSPQEVEWLIENL